VRDIAPVLQIPQADLLVIAGIAAPPPTTSAPYRNPAEIGALVSIATSLSDEQLRKLIDLAHHLKSEDRN